MKIIILGNAGAGKSTLSRNLIARHAAAHLSLDDVAFDDGAKRRPIEDSLAEAKRWMAEHESWIIEGCYADLIEPLLPYCDELIFLNPGVEACIAHCRSRPWEPDKFASPDEQNAHMEKLLEWVGSYATRTDEYGLVRHRKLFDAFAGEKREYHDPSEYGSL